MGSIDENGRQANEGPMEIRSQDDPAELFLASMYVDPDDSSPVPRRSRWEKSDDAPAPIPVWTRYVESRMRQFGEGR